MKIEIQSVHAHLAIFDMPRALAFYCDTFEFDIAHASAEPSKSAPQR